MYQVKRAKMHLGNNITSGDRMYGCLYVYMKNKSGECGIRAISIGPGDKLSLRHSTLSALLSSNVSNLPI
ncbi:hypothetical protein ACTXT7_007353 [Hymenolepis weldensis]